MSPPARGRGGACSHLLPNLLRAPGFMFSEKTLLCGQLRGKDCREEGRSCWLPPKILGGPGRGPIHRVFPEPGAQGPTQEDSEEAPGEGLCRAVETGLSRQGSVSSRPCRMITPSGVLSPRSGATSPAPLSGRHPQTKDEKQARGFRRLGRKRMLAGPSRTCRCSEGAQQRGHVACEKRQGL